MRARCGLVSVLCLAAALAACGDDDGGGGDLGGTQDLAGADLPIVLPDLSVCSPPTFQGFPGDSTSERRFDCSLCGCVIDPLDMVLSQGLWVKTAVDATLSQSAAGFSIVTSGADSGYGSLASLNPVGSFFLDGDFDLRVQWATGPLVPGGKVSLRFDVMGGASFEVARVKKSDGTDVYRATLGGIVSEIPTTGVMGLLRLTREGFNVTAYGDAMMVGSTTGGAAARAPIYLLSGVQGCTDPVDGGVVDGFFCAQGATLQNLRLASGALVDRR